MMPRTARKLSDPTIPSRRRSSTFPTASSQKVDPISNSQATSNPTVQLTLSPDPAYIVGSPSTATVTIEEATPYQNWKISEFGPNATVPSIGGDTADPNHNGVPNFLEYAFNSNPLQTGTEPLPILVFSFHGCPWSSTIRMGWLSF